MKLKIDSNSKIVLIVIMIAIISIASLSVLRKRSSEYELGKILINPPIEYTKLFSKDKFKGIVYSQNYQTESGNVISRLDYGNKYFINIVRLDTVGDKSLKTFVSLRNEKDLKVEGGGYYPFGSNILDIKYRGVFPKFPHLLLNIYGDSTTVVALNDTVAAISSNFKILSVRSINTDTSVIYSLSNGSYPDIPTSTVPINILFLKRDKILYLLMLSIKNKGIPLKDDELYRLVLGK